MNAAPKNGEDNVFAIDPTSFSTSPVPGTHAATAPDKKTPKVSLRRTAEPQSAVPSDSSAKLPKKGKLGSPPGGLRLPTVSDFGAGTLMTLALYAVIVGMTAYAFQSGTWQKISKIPTAKASVAVSKDNLAKQKQEKAYLDSLSVDDKDLSRKESALASYFPKENPKLRLAQTAAIDRLAQES